jgi:hypothetical protein
MKNEHTGGIPILPTITLGPLQANRWPAKEAIKSRAYQLVTANTSHQINKNIITGRQTTTKINRIGKQLNSLCKDGKFNSSSMLLLHNDI